MIEAETPKHSAGLSAHNLLRIRDREVTLIEADVIIRAEAQDVPQDVRTVMGAPERLDVGTFGIKTARCFYLAPADLARMRVDLLHLPGDDGRPN